MTKYAVAGNPVLMSKSPQLFNFIFDDQSINSYYTRIADSSAKKILNTAYNLGFQALNITMPHKIAMADSIDNSTFFVRNLNSTNCIVYKNESWYAYNTDIYGVMKSIKSINLRNIKQCLIFGAGGAARAAAYAAKLLHFDTFIYSRNNDNSNVSAIMTGAKSIAEDDIYPTIDRCELIINTTPVTPLFLNNIDLTGKIYFNADYHTINPLKSNYIHGKEWLIHQAIKSYELFKHKSIDYQSFETTFSLQAKPLYPIAFIGFMGAGKTTIAKRIATLFNIPFIDLDHYIEQQTNMYISKIFSTYGQNYFRSLEENALKSFKNKKVIISCGGGIIENNNSLSLLKKFYTNIYLYCHFDISNKRIQNSYQRPLLNKGVEYLYNLYNSRINKYIACSDLIISNNDNIDNTIEIAYDNINSAL